MNVITLNTPREGFINITAQVQDLVRASGVNSGMCHVFVVHTTAAITVNENADLDVVHDLLKALGQMVPNISYRHCEGNSPAHIKSMLVGCSAQIPVEQGRLCLGTWQGIYFCEFDGPRSRNVCVQIMNAA